MPESQEVEEVETEPWLSPGEAAALLAVTTATLAAWADAGRIASRRLPSGHRRYLASSVHNLAQSGRHQERSA